MRTSRCWIPLYTDYLVEEYGDLDCDYVFVRALADFVRCRDLTCRWSGYDTPAIDCDVDHTIPYADGGPTHASNLKCYCRTHHLVKTFWGGQEKQLSDGTLILTSPAGHTYVTTPGSALLFPALCVPTGDLASADPARMDSCGDPTAMMPRRKITRAQNPAAYIAAERRQNQRARETRRQTRLTALFGPAPPADLDEDDPPF